MGANWEQDCTGVAFSLRSTKGGLRNRRVVQRGKKIRLSFRYGGRLFRHSLGVEKQKEADERLALVEPNLRLMEEGILELPRGADLPLFLLSGGKLTAKPEVHAVLTLGELVDRYLGVRLFNTLHGGVIGFSPPGIALHDRSR
jgi:hypothetical protein